LNTIHSVKQLTINALNRNAKVSQISKNTRIKGKSSLLFLENISE